MLSVTFFGRFITNINNEHAQDYSCPGQLLRSVHMEKSYHGKAGYPVLYNGVSELPRGNELSRDHVNRPLVSSDSSEKQFANSCAL